METGRSLWESTLIPQLLYRRISGFKSEEASPYKALQLNYFSFCVAVMEKNN
jgi:hypothetical protein